MADESYPDLDKMIENIWRLTLHEKKRLQYVVTKFIEIEVDEE